MSADWWLEGGAVDPSNHHAHSPHEHSWNLTYNLNRMLWEAGWQWPPDETGGLSTAPQTSLPNQGVWSTKYLNGARMSDLGEKVLLVVTNLRERPEHFKQWNPPNEWGSYDNALEVFEDFLAAIQAHPDATLGTFF